MFEYKRHEECHVDEKLGNDKDPNANYDNPLQRFHLNLFILKTIQNDQQIMKITLWVKI